MKDAEDEEDGGGAFQVLLGKFGSHANPNRRAKAERLASMSTTDKRRRQGPPRPHQYNGKISTAKWNLAKAVEKARGYGPGGLIEEGAELIAEKHGIRIRVDA